MTSTRDVRGYVPGVDEPGIRAVMEASLAFDRLPGQTARDIDRTLTRIPADPAGTIVATEGDRIVAYCIPAHSLLTVAPDARRRGHGRSLVTAARRRGRARGESTLNLYVPHHLDASAAFAAALGLTYHSSLWVFELPPDRPVPPAAFPADIVVRTWAPNEDIVAWAAFNNAAFEGHPSPLVVTPELVQAVHDHPDFDPEGILLAAAATEPDRWDTFGRGARGSWS
ncbi:MAG TPA: GNAT family N-acetyltransferase [Candidatus Limnocylindrales bacterium]